MAIFDQATLSRLLDSIEANRLVILCGAGLSIPAPSNLMSALRVAQTCYDRRLPHEQLPAECRDNIDKLAEHFHRLGRFKDIFLDTLVPWDDLVGDANDGHAAVADFLICRATTAALSANFDPLIEQWSDRNKVDMRGALDANQAQEYSNHTSPLLKFHGCLKLGRSKTLWAHSQIADPEIAPTIQSCRDWIRINIPNKDLLIVGFWTDWEYLNEALQEVIAVNGLRSVTVIDLQDEAALQQKAPVLWAKLSVVQPFKPIIASSIEALAELRREFSRVWLKKFFRLGQPLIEEAGAVYPSAIETVGWEDADLYRLRQDAEGKPYSRAARTREPGPESREAAFLHLLLKNAGAEHNGAWYSVNGATVRVLQATGESLAMARDKQVAAPALAKPDVTICAGAVVVTDHANIVSGGEGNSIVRPAATQQSIWLTTEQARERLAI